MKYFALALISAAFTISSCSNCYECNLGTKDNPDVRELCKKNFYGEKEMFEKTIKEYELAGYECTKK